MTLSNHKLATSENGATEITQTVAEAVKASGVEDGLCIVFVPHTTAGLSITSRWDAKGLEDIHDDIDRLVPTRIDFKHQFDTPQDAAGHVKSVLVGVSLPLIITEGALLLGHSQGIFFHEFDGPRQRQFFVRCGCD
ncbi:secondary thiamine-phosphate synthase enzyme YjbQ [Consotaella aegiceratis]|uniref:secondary thiamine-phosphate synthase enzyme YjbQ n=1 Tax=Consotaella aegiceratis TaxID=3097961 RepID=UPI002F3FBEA9